jgi:hypothetical protein
MYSIVTSQGPLFGRPRTNIGAIFLNLVIHAVLAEV